MQNKKINIEQTKENGTLLCKLSGWLDPNTSPELQEKLNLTDVSLLIIDMKNVEYVFSSGLRVILLFQKQLSQNGGQIKIINVPDAIRTIFEYTGFESILEPKS